MNWVIILSVMSAHPQIPEKKYEDVVIRYKNVFECTKALSGVQDMAGDFVLENDTMIVHVSRCQRKV